MSILCLMPFTLLAEHYLEQPDRVPYFDFDFVEHVALPFMWSYIGILALIVVTGLWLRTRRGDPAWFGYATTVTICLGSGTVLSWMFGQYTSPVAIGLLWTISTTGFVLFDKKPVFLGLALAMIVLGGVTVCQQAGLIRYAPLFVGSVVTNGHLANTWLVGTGGGLFLMMLALLVFTSWVILSWHAQEQIILETSDQLERANAVISRYVARQLVDEIHAGHYEHIEQHARRKLTLFFSDVEDFTGIADEMEPEDFSELLNEYLSEMAAIGERYGATIDKFVGDAVVIFFGAPRSLEAVDQARSAVHMAIEMQRRMAELTEKWVASGIERPFRIRIGINTGQATVGNFGSSGRIDYTAIGRQVNLAARLQSACEPGRILVSHTTWSLIRDEIECVSRGALQVKGFARPIEAYEVAERVLTDLQSR